ncbi:MAG: PQQ-dependent sugar dehydrogenase [Tepidisphaeraceae bacterium]
MSQGEAAKLKAAAQRTVVETLEWRRLLASVATTTPYQGQQLVGVSANITVKFTDAMTPASLTSSTLQLRDPAGNVLASTVTYDSTTKTATINPSANLQSSANYYTVKVVGGASGVKDGFGGALAADYSFSFTTGTPTFTEKTIFSGLIQPTSVQFSSDGRVFVAEKRGVIKVFNNLSDNTPTVFADLRTQVDNTWDRGLLAIALDPQFTTGRPYIYALYTADADIGGTAPKYGTANTDSDPAAGDGTNLVSCRLVKLTATGNVMSGTEKVLVNDWQNQFPSHSIGDLAFGPDGYLYASAGDGANFNAVDYGNYGNPFNDPANEGGALRSQDVRTTADPTGLDGSIIRIDPDTGAGAAGNPFASSTDANARRIIAYGLRNPYRLTFKPGTSEMYISDVGWNTYEEINRLGNVTATTATNFGWPAYEGPNKQSGYDALDLPLLESLYASGGATSPFFSYSHSEQIVAGTSEPTGGSATTGLAFYNSDVYAPGYDGALFFADYARQQIYVMYRGADGNPDPSTRKIFKSLSSERGIVDLKVGPDGNLYYVDLYQGTIQRFDYTNPSPPATTGKLTGEVIGTLGSYANNGFTRDKAVDGDVYTFFDAPIADGAWVGLDFGTSKAVRRITFAPRFDWPDRLVGGVFQASNDATFATGMVTLYTVTKTPTAGALTSVDVNPSAVAYRYVRFLGANGSAANIAEINFYDTPDVATGTGTGLSAAYFNTVDLTGASVSRIDSVINIALSGDQSPATGIDPLTYSIRWTGQVQAVEAGTYTFGLTGDDGVRLWVDGQLLIDKWINQAPTRYTASVTLAAGEKKDIRVEYYQNTQGATAKLEWKRPGQTAFELVPQRQLYPTAGSAPVPTINTPASSLQWKVGDAIAFSGNATDAEDGTLPASALTWTVVLFHGNLIDPDNAHEHVLQTFTGVSSGSFIAPDHEYPSWLELRLTATDSNGKTTTVSRRLDPLATSVTLNSNVPGVTLTLNDGSGVSTVTAGAIVGSSVSISADPQIVVGGKTLLFTGWSDGGDRSHTISAPAAATTLTAFYAEALAQPTDLEAVALSPTQVQLSWTDNAPAETGYVIQRRVAGTTTWATIKTAVADSDLYVDATAAAGVSYEYRVAATDGVTTGTYSQLAAVITPLPTPTSLAPSAVTTSGVTLTWTDNATNESGYRVERRLTGGTFAVIATLAVNTVTFTDSGLNAGAGYEYRVRAYNAVTDSAPSNVVTVTTLSTTVVLTSPGNLRGEVTSAYQIALTWEDRATGETTYRVDRRLKGGSFSKLATIAANSTSYLDTSVAKATAYEYRVLALDGTTLGTYSSTLSVSTATVGPVAPNAPGSLAVTTVSASSLLLKWTDNSANEAGFLIERRIGSGTWAQIASVGAGVATYTNTGLTTNTTYQYRIRAYYGTTYSVYSSAVSGTTS